MPRDVNCDTYSQCNQSVGNKNSICCSMSNIWHNLECSALEFSKHVNNITLTWVCEKCSVYKCGECIKKQECILFNSCEQ